MGGVWMRRSAAALVVAGVLGWTGNSAWCQTAPAITGEGAQALASALDAGVRQWFPAAGEGASYSWDGRVKAAVAGDRYDVDLPALQMAGENGSRINVGVIHLSLTPAADGSWSVAATFPASVTAVAADGKPEGEVTIGSQHFLGRWVPALQSFVRMDSSFGNIRVASRKSAGQVVVGALDIRSDLKEEKPGRWSGPSSLKLSSLQITGEKGDDGGRIGGITIAGDIRNMDLAATAGTVAAEAQGQGKAGDPVAAIRKRFNTLRTMLGGATGRLEIQGLDVVNPSDNVRFGLGQVALQFGVDGLDGDKSTVSLGYDHSGLKLTPAPGPAEFTPERVELGFAIADLPNSALWASAERFLDGSGNDKDAGTADQLQGQILSALTQAGSRLKVERLRLDTPATAANLTGEARFNNKSVFGLTVNLDMVLRGLERAIALFQPQPGAKPEEDGAGIGGVLAMMQAFGAPGKDSQGRDIRSYKVDVTEDGRIVLNGADMSALFGGGAPGGGAGEQPPKGQKAPGAKAK